MSEQSKNGFWNRLKEFGSDKANTGFTVIPGKQYGGLHVQYEDGSVSVISVPRNVYELSPLR